VTTIETRDADDDAGAKLIPEWEVDADDQVIVGWTDTQGDEGDNLALSQARADAVVAYLVGAGAGDASLTVVGNGKTDQFAAGDAPAALQANRVVLFEQTG